MENEKPPPVRRIDLARHEPQDLVDFMLGKRDLIVEEKENDRFAEAHGIRALVKKAEKLDCLKYPYEQDDEFLLLRQRAMAAVSDWAAKRKREVMSEIERRLDACFESTDE